MRQDDDALPEHKREGWAERMYEKAEAERDRRKEEELLASIANQWAIDTGCKISGETK